MRRKNACRLLKQCDLNQREIKSVATKCLQFSAWTFQAVLGTNRTSWIPSYKMGNGYLAPQTFAFFSPFPCNKGSYVILLIRSFCWITYFNRWKFFCEESIILEAREGRSFILRLPSSGPRWYLLKDVLVPVSKYIIKQNYSVKMKPE